EHARKPDVPAVFVSWDDAQAFCAWLTDRDRKAGKIGANESYRLPSDHEWSCAVGIGDREDPAKTPEEKDGKLPDVYPWGTAWPAPANTANYFGREADEEAKTGQVPGLAKGMAQHLDSHVRLAPVGSYSANPFGIHDLGGNVSELCDDWWSPAQAERTLRGGSWVVVRKEHCMSSHRTSVLQKRAPDIYFGFRVVLAPFAAGSTTSTPLEPGAIRLWDTPEKVPANKEGVAWRDDALFVHSANLHALRTQSPTSAIKSRDSIVRFSLRMNPDARWGSVAIRSTGSAQTPRAYQLRINPPGGHFDLEVQADGAARKLKVWKMPELYRPNEWLRVELRTVGDTLTISVDGKPFETVRDATLPGPGMMTLGATANCFFRDIEYVPLDEVEVGAPTAGNTQKWVDARQDAEFAKGNFMLRPESAGWTVIAQGSTMFAAGPGRDGAVRMRAVFDPKDNIGLIARGGGTPHSFYKANVLTSGDEAGLNYLVGGIFTGALNEKGPVHIKRKLPAPIQPGEEYEIELRAVGDLFTVRLNGEVVLESRDPERATGKFGISFRTLGKERRIVSLEYLDLSSSAPTATAASATGGEVRTFGGHRYQMVPGAWKWDVAKAKAEAMGGHLVTINSKEEDEFVRQAFGDQVPETKNLYLGASREKADAPLQWVTGEPFSYSALPQNRPGDPLRSDDFPKALVLWRAPQSSTVGWREHTQRTADRRIGFLVEWDDDVRAKPSGAVTPNGAATATKDAPFVNTLGMKFVPVPITGGPTGGQRVLFSVWETRVQDYEAFIKHTQREWTRASFEQGPTHPAVNVLWDDARAFCAWLTERERKAGKISAGECYRLPSDHEWSDAVGIGAREDAAQTPAKKDLMIVDAFFWGSAWPPPVGAGNFGGQEMQADVDAGRAGYKGQTLIAGYHDGFVQSSPVGSFAPNPLGLYDLGGNAQEWCEDWFDEKKECRVLRGLGWSSSDRRYLFASRRTDGVPTKRNGGYGFRVVLAPAAP
ncbi:MAG: SUMF1/EgtB/PvdO family nonheme iron enzyme, partial [Chthoniobacteraceae bacterium]